VQIVEGRLKQKGEHWQVQKGVNKFLNRFK
jgi:hypothetical protein